MGQSNPQGVPNTIKAIADYIGDLADNVFKDATKTGMWTPNENLVRGFNKAKTGYLPTLTMQGLGNYDRVKGYPNGAVDLKWTPYELRYDRGRKFNLDDVDVMQQQGQLEFGYVLGEFVRQRIVPEVDALNIAAVAGAAEEGDMDGNKVENQVIYGFTPTAANIVSQILKGIRRVKNSTYLESGINVHVNNKFMEFLDTSTEVQKTRDVFGTSSRLNSIINELNGGSVIPTSSSVMFGAVELKDGIAAGSEDGGYTGSREIAYLITAPGCVNAITAHQATKIILPDANQSADATSIMYRTYFDCLVPKNKRAGIEVAFTGAAPVEPEP